MSNSAVADHETETSGPAGAGPSGPSTPPDAELSPSTFSPGVPADTSITALHDALYAETRVPSSALAVLSLSDDEQESTRHNYWEPDADVSACRGCDRRFTFFLRRHHCRRCGRIYCDACTAAREHLSADEIVYDHEMPEMAAAEVDGVSRVCNQCASDRRELEENHSIVANVFDMVGRMRRRVASTESVPATSDDASENASEIDECPVCETPIRNLGPPEREEHIRACLESGTAHALQNTRYLVSMLSADSPLAGSECIICMEEFEAGTAVARLHCLCCFHRSWCVFANSIDAWLKNGGGCPVHASEL